MKKEKLKRLKAGILAVALCFTLNGCGNKDKNIETSDEAIVVFIQGKALIYAGKEKISVIEEYTGIGGNVLKYSETTRFSTGVDAVVVQSLEDASELAAAIVGEENIIYIDYKDKDMQLTYTKKLK